MNWLITGGCGFIGTSLIRRILHEDNESKIIVIDNLIGQKEDLARFVNLTMSQLKIATGSNSVKFIQGDILDDKTSDILCRDIDAMVHLAANTVYNHLSKSNRRS